MKPKPSVLFFRCCALAMALMAWLAASADGQLSLPNYSSAIDSAESGGAATPDPDAWPRQFKDGGVVYTIYQPQIEGWTGQLLTGCAAVSVQAESGAAKEPTYGVLYLSAETQIDRSERMVEFENLTVVRANFPSIADPTLFLQELRDYLPQSVRSMSLDRFESSLAILDTAKQARSEPLNNTPPAIVFSDKPALLVSIDGEPKWAGVGTGKMNRVLNTHVLLLRDASGVHYLHLFDGYLTAAKLDGPWTVLKKIPTAVVQAQEQLVAAKQVDLLAGQPDPETKKSPSLATNEVPVVVIAMQPTELIITEGKPEWTPLEGTQLLYVKNTPAHIFKQLVDKQTYVLISGRWFQSEGPSGPWVYVAAKALPADFAAIPDNSPKENIKASVPGTRQAQEALIADGIPTTSRITRSSAKMDPLPTFDGEPKIAAIAGTDVFHVANCATPILTVDYKRWYACQSGVWFVANVPQGPWAAAASVPVAFYSIPPSSPFYSLTYVRIYRADDAYVWIGYTPGYYGTVVGADGVVVYGTGYVYPPYVSETFYVSYPPTYGYATNACWTPWTGWSFAFAAGWAWGAHWNYWACVPPAPYWGPYWSYSYGVWYNAAGGITAWGPAGWAGTSGNIYAQAGPWSSVSRVSAGYNAWTGNRWASQYGHAYNSVTGTNVAGRRGAVANVYSGDYAVGGRGVASNSRTGVVAAGSHFTAGNAYTGNEISGGRGAVYNPNTGNTTGYAGVRGEDGGVYRVGDQVVAGRDGNVYVRDPAGSWSQVSSGADPKTGTNMDSSSMNREVQARDTGGQRAQSFGAMRGGFGGGRGR
jgi:hypothetical protein